MTNPIARCTRIDLDGEEMPTRLYLELSGDVVERVRQDFDMEATALGVPAGCFSVELSFAEAAHMARHFGRHPGEPWGAFYYCIDKVACRFWDNGLREAPSAGLVAKSTEEAV